jgi:spoIIIJ-associated protein
MTTIEAKTLEEAYAQAAVEFNCSITDLEIDVLQDASSGFLGLFKKNAIIEVNKKGAKKFSKSRDRKDKREGNQRPPRPEVNIDEVIDEIKSSVQNLISSSCYDIQVLDVAKHDEKTVLVKLDGEDAALVIGKEGYRYNSLVTILYNWLNLKYNLLVRLEVSKFLQTQEENINNYIDSLDEYIKEGKRVKTKILDGILVRLALRELKKRYPNKYIRVKRNRENKKYIIVEELRNSE